MENLHRIALLFRMTAGCAAVLLRRKVVEEHHRQFRAGGPALGIKAVSAFSGHHAAAPGPVHCAGRKCRDDTFIGVVLPSSGGTSRIPPQDCGQLLPGHRVIRTETAAAIAVHELIAHSPVYGLSVPCPGSCIREVRTRIDFGTSRSTV